MQSRQMQLNEAEERARAFRAFKARKWRERDRERERGRGRGAEEEQKHIIQQMLKAN